MTNCPALCKQFLEKEMNETHKETISPAEYIVIGAILIYASIIVTVVICNIVVYVRAANSNEEPKQPTQAPKRPTLRRANAQSGFKGLGDDPHGIYAEAMVNKAKRT
tara:strand:+ start:2796 stop:3116 length:321 start_codon:yes stop_codon:yes gene_type:complete